MFNIKKIRKDIALIKERKKMKIKIFTLKIKVKQDDNDTVIISLNDKKVNDDVDTFLWKITDMHRHNIVQYAEEKPTIEGALSEIIERIPHAKDIHDL